MLNEYLFTGKSPLKLEVHKPLVHEADKLCAIAGISKDYLRSTADKLPGFNSLKNYRESLQRGIFGFYVTDDVSNVETFKRLTAVALRNYVDARYRLFADVIEDPTAGEIIFIPHIDANPPSWMVEKVLNVLITRQSRNLVTVFGIPTLKDYPSDFKKYLNRYYLHVSAEKGGRDANTRG